LILLAIGYGLGSFVSNIQGVSYMDFFFPALLCMSSMMVSFFEATYGNFAKLTYQNVYSTMVLTSLEPRQIVIGEILWAATKGTLSALSVAMVANFFGHLDGVRFIPAVAVIFLSSFVFASFGMLITSAVKGYDGIIYPTSGLIVPMSLFSGTYFPLDQLPYGLKYLSYIFPLTHSVSLVRGFLNYPEVWWQMALHLLVLIALSAIFLKWSIRRIERKLVI
jgi:lipooligosaccharide transport system permease protein